MALVRKLLDSWPIKEPRTQKRHQFIHSTAPTSEQHMRNVLAKAFLPFKVTIIQAWFIANDYHKDRVDYLR